jgi:hypothetical protein
MLHNKGGIKKKNIYIYIYIYIERERERERERPEKMDHLTYTQTQK